MGLGVSVGVGTGNGILSRTDCERMLQGLRSMGLNMSRDMIPVCMLSVRKDPGLENIG